MILALFAFCFQVTTGGVQTPPHAENVEVTDAWPPVADAVNDPEVRRQFILREKRIKEGMTRRQVRQILGEPDEIVAGSGSPNEFWNYGTAGPGTMPVLGVVRFNPDGKAFTWRYHRPRAAPPPVSLISEGSLRAYMRLLHRGTFDRTVDLLAIIRIVNALHPLGAERALAVFREYNAVLGETSAWDCPNVVLALRVLFAVPKCGYAPISGIPVIGVNYPQDRALVPRFPVVMAGDIPFVLPPGGGSTGNATTLGDQIEQYVGVPLRDSVLRPPDSPSTALSSLMASSEWSLLLKVPSDLRVMAAIAKFEVAQEVAQLLRTAHVAPDYSQGAKASEAETFAALESFIAGAKVRWDAASCQYTRLDATTLPQPRRIIPASWIWKNQTLVDRDISITLEYDRVKNLLIHLSYARYHRGKPRLLVTTRIDGKVVGSFDPQQQEAPGDRESNEGGRSYFTSFGYTLETRGVVELTLSVDGAELKSPPVVFAPANRSINDD